MKLKIWFLIVLIAVPNLVAGQKSRYVGYRHKGVISGELLPNKVKNLGGGLLSDENYGVSRFSKNGRIMLWLEKITARDKNGVPSWKVKDVLSFGKIQKNQNFLFSYSSNCLQNNEQTLDLIVRAQIVQKTKNYKVIQAWRANLRQERFEKVSIKGIECAAVER